MKVTTRWTGRKTTLRLLLAGVLTLYVTGIFGAETVRIAIMGDHRGDNKAWNATKDGYTDGGFNKAVLIDIATALKNEKPDVVMEVGDVATKHTPQLINVAPDVLLTRELTEWGNIWKQYSGNLPIFPVRGNQEVSVSAAVWQAWAKTMPGIGEIAWNGPVGEEGLTYSFTYKNCLFVGIDEHMPPGNNDTHPITTNALIWLNETLKAPNKPFKFVVGHVPAFEVWDVGKTPLTQMKDGLASPGGPATPGGSTTPLFSYDLLGLNFVATRELFWDLLGEHGAQYFCGHDHMYARSLAQGTQGKWVRQVIIGNGGAPVVAEFDPAKFPLGPLVESYTGDFPTRNSPTTPAYHLDQPRVALEYFPPAFTPDPTKPTVKNYGFGYLIIDVQGSKATARYMAEAKAGAGFQMVDTWEMKADNNQSSK